MTKLFHNVSLLGSVLMAAAAETGSSKPAKTTKAKSDTSKTKGNAKGAKAAAPVTEKKVGGGRKQPIFSDRTKIHEALTFLSTGNMDGFLKAGFSQHHIRQLGKGVSGGLFKEGLEMVEMVKDESPRKDGENGRRPLVPQLTAKGKSALKTFEANAARKAGNEAKSNAKSKTRAEKAAEAPAAPVQEAAAPEVTVTVPEGTEVQVETVAQA